MYCLQRQHNYLALSSSSTAQRRRRRKAKASAPPDVSKVGSPRDAETKAALAWTHRHTWARQRWKLSINPNPIFFRGTIKLAKAIASLRASHIQRCSSFTPMSQWKAQVMFSSSRGGWQRAPRHIERLESLLPFPISATTRQTVQSQAAFIQNQGSGQLLVPTPAGLTHPKDTFCTPRGSAATKREDALNQVTAITQPRLKSESGNRAGAGKAVSPPSPPT